jgi:hypothetical protein
MTISHAQFIKDMPMLTSTLFTDCVSDYQLPNDDGHGEADATD